MKYTRISELCVVDPDSGGDVHIEVWKDNTTDGIFALDSSFIEQVDNFYNPFSGEREDMDECLS